MCLPQQEDDLTVGLESEVLLTDGGYFEDNRRMKTFVGLLNFTQ